MSDWTTNMARHMAQDELRTIKVDSFHSDIWGSTIDDTAHTISRSNTEALSTKAAVKSAVEISQQRKPPRLFFYFGRNDHWVAAKTRDELIKSRGSQTREGKGPWMEVDEGGLPHGFCLRKGEIPPLIHLTQSNLPTALDV